MATAKMSWWREPKSSISSSNNKNNQTRAEAEAEAKVVKCDCCALTEECTPAYIARVRERYAGGRWICGLCSEAVEDEIVRSGRHPIATEEALSRHKSFLRSFRSSSSKPPPDPKERLISAMRQLLRRSFGSPRATRAAARSRGAPDMIGDEAGAAASELRLA